MNIDDKIDVCLKKLYEVGENNQFTLFADALYGDSFMYDVPDPIDRAMINKGLIERMKDARMLTEFGIRISQQGGWNQYLKQKQEATNKESEAQRELQILTKKQLELSIREMQVNFTQIKHWWLILIITIVASAVLGALFQALF